jgi:hypothetical protein
VVELLLADGAASWTSIVESTAEPVASGTSAGAMVTGAVSLPDPVAPASVPACVAGSAPPPEAPPQPAMMAIAHAATAARKIPLSI